ncbi:hypothetical protein Ciccas_012797 [Cichlidogyrus casuarinus]|uniref:Uncharacterized protein n=1 Tax=Cichlidogyrus casuarinus TaxID=1844966 RepID=A0ABD2PPQ8_9PLAT
MRIGSAKELSVGQLMMEPPSYHETISKYSSNSLPKEENLAIVPPTGNSNIIIVNKTKSPYVADKADSQIHSAASTSMYTTAKSTPFGTSPGSPISEDYSQFEPALSHAEQEPVIEEEEPKIIVVNGENYDGLHSKRQASSHSSEQDRQAYERRRKARKQARLDSLREAEVSYRPQHMNETSRQSDSETEVEGP